MARRLILDTGVLVDAERNGDADTSIAADDDVVIAAITLAELRTGVELASGAARQRRSHFLARVLDVVPVEAYTSNTAEMHAKLLAHVHRSGRKRGAHDLLIAATAIATGRTLVTTDHRARFAELPDLECVVID